LAFASALFLALAPTAGAAGAKDKDAQKLLDGAMNDDYLATDFAKAEKKLKDALSKCGSDGCSKELVGKIHVALGTVHGVGQNKMDDAKADFVNALKADPKAALDASLTTPELTKAFEEAKKSAGGGSSSKPDKTPDKPAPAGDAQHKPPAESQVNTPLPIYVEPSDEVPLSKVTLRYKPFGATQYKSIEMKKMGKGFGVELPCEDVTTTGELKYFFAFTGADGDAAGGLGSNKEPFKVVIKNEIEGDAPKLPGKKAPEQCKEKGDCPPGLPGCEDKKGGGGGKRGDKGWGSSCDNTQECKEGLVCLNGTCEEGKGGDDKGGGGDDGDKNAKKRMNLVGAGVQFDMLVINGAQDVCSGTNSSYQCFKQGTSDQFFGYPVAFKNTNGIQGGFGFADVRIYASYDRLLLKNIGLALGVRFGVAIGGTPSPGNLDGSGNPPKGSNPAIAPAVGFPPIHGEARLSYFILNSMMEDKKFRPYVFIGGGVGKVSASVPVAVCDKDVKMGEGTGGCMTTPASTARNVDAYQITGLSFLDVGAGTTFGVTPLFGFFVEAKAMFMIPTFGVVIAPAIGPVFNF
jgi:hypothetical protein